MDFAAGSVRCQFRLPETASPSKAQPTVCLHACVAHLRLSCMIGSKKGFVPLRWHVAACRHTRFCVTSRRCMPPPVPRGGARFNNVGYHGCLVCRRLRALVAVKVRLDKRQTMCYTIRAVTQCHIVSSSLLAVQTSTECGGLDEVTALPPGIFPGLFLLFFDK